MNKDFIHIASSIRSPGGTIAGCSAQLLDIQPVLNSRAQSVPDHNRLSARIDGGGILPSSAGGTGCVLRHNRFFASYKTDTGWLFGRTGQYIQYGQAVDNRSAMAVYELVFPVLHSLFSLFNSYIV